MTNPKRGGDRNPPFLNREALTEVILFKVANNQTPALTDSNQAYKGHIRVQL